MFAIIPVKQIFSQIEHVAIVIQDKDLTTETAATCIQTIYLYLEARRKDQGLIELQ